MFDLSEKTGINDFINKHCREMGRRGRRFDFQTICDPPWWARSWGACLQLWSGTLSPCVDEAGWDVVQRQRGGIWRHLQGTACAAKCRLTSARCHLPSWCSPVALGVQGWALTLRGQDAAVQAQRAGFALCSWPFQAFPLLNEAVSFPSACICTFAGVSFNDCAGWQGRAWCCLRHSHGLTQMSPWASHRLPFQRIILNRQVGKRATRIIQRQEMTLSISKIK